MLYIMQFWSGSNSDSVNLHWPLPLNFSLQWRCFGFQPDNVVHFWKSKCLVHLFSRAKIVVLFLFNVIPARLLHHGFLMRG
ncbi:hypothetical protein AAZX31_17G154600 [Glycine max]